MKNNFKFLKAYLQEMTKQNIDINSLDRFGLGKDSFSGINIETLSKIVNQEYDVIDANGYWVIDSQNLLKTAFDVDEYDGYGDAGYQWNLYKEGVGSGYEWNFNDPSTVLTELTTDTVQDPSTVLTLTDGGFTEQFYTWNYNDSSTTLEVQ